MVLLAGVFTVFVGEIKRITCVGASCRASLFCILFGQLFFGSCFAHCRELAVLTNANVVGDVVEDCVRFIFLERFRKAVLCFSRSALADSEWARGKFGTYVRTLLSASCGCGWSNPTSSATFHTPFLFFCQIVTKCSNASGFSTPRDLVDSRSPVV